MSEIFNYNDTNYSGNEEPSDLFWSNEEEKSEFFKYCLIFIFWAFLISFLYIGLGTNSYIPIWDNGDGNLPNHIAKWNMPNRSHDFQWEQWRMCGVDSIKSDISLLHWLFFVFSSLTFGVVAIIQRFLAGFFTFLLLRRIIGVNPFYALSAGLLYPLAKVDSNYFVFYNLFSEPGFPFFLFFLEWIYRHKQLLARIGLYFIFGLFFTLFNHFFYIYASIFLIIIFWLFALRRWQFRDIIYLSIITIAVSIVFHISQIISTMEILNTSLRSVESQSWPTFTETIAKYTIKQSKLLIIKYPTLCIITGLGFFFGTWRIKWVRMLSYCIVFSFVFFPLFQYTVRALPLLKSIGAYHFGRGYQFVPFFLIIISVISLERIIKCLSKFNKEKNNKVKLLITSLIVIGFIFIAFGTFFKPFYLYLRAMQINDIVPFGILHSKRMVQLVIIIAIMLVAGIISIYHLIASFNNKPGALPKLKYLIIILAISTALDHYKEIIWTGDRMHVLYNKDQFKRIAALQDNTKPFRVTTAYVDYQNQELFPCVSGLEVASGRVSISQRVFRKFWDRVVAGVISNSELGRKAYFSHNCWMCLVSPFYKQYRKHTPPSENKFRDDFNLDLLSLINTKYLFSPHLIDDERLVPYYIDPENKLHIYENTEALERFNIIFKALSFDDLDNLLDTLATRDIAEIKNELFVIDGSTDVLEPDSTVSDSAKIIVKRYESDIIELDVYSSKHAYLTVSNTYSKFWQAYVGDQKANVFPAYGVFQAIIIPAGEHEIRFVYER